MRGLCRKPHTPSLVDSSGKLNHGFLCNDTPFTACKGAFGTIDHSQDL